MPWESIEKLREEFAAGDEKRDANFTTPEDICRCDNIPYGPDPVWNLLDVYCPREAAGVLPCIVSIHGGGWVYGTKEVYQYYGMNLAQRGFAVVNFNYRLAPENRYPAGLQDINRVFEWILKHGKDYHIDTGNLFVVGDSAGGQLATQYVLMTVNPEYAKLCRMEIPEGLAIRAVGLNCGSYDTEAGFCGEKNRMLREAYLGEGCKELPEDLKVMKYMTKAFPPSFITSSVHDFLLEQAYYLEAYCKKLGIVCEKHIYGAGDRPEAAHVFHVNIALPEAAACNDAECAFFRKYQSRGQQETEARLKKQLNFILETDREKKIGRQTYLSDGSRKETDAEHAWHLALMVLLLAEHANEPIDVLHTVYMVLIHDLVEIDAGDTYAYDEKGNQDKREREERAADRIFSILPQDQAQEIRALWEEFEEGKTPEARFAVTLDKIQPLLLNDASGGISWQEHHVAVSKVLRRNGKTHEGSERLWEYGLERIRKNQAEGRLYAEIYLAGGCFWGAQRYFDCLPGVVETEVGYANGPTENPTYEQVKKEHTGHAETVRVVYNAKEIPLPALLEQYYKIIDPTAVNHQGEDIGIQYRTGVYYTDSADEPVIRASLEKLQKDYTEPLAVEARPLENFYPAEEYHQKYLEKNPGGYCHVPAALFEAAKKFRV